MKLEESDKVFGVICASNGNEMNDKLMTFSKAITLQRDLKEKGIKDLFVVQVKVTSLFDRYVNIFNGGN